MNDFLKRVANMNEYASIVDDGVETGDVESFIDTGSYVFNALLSGSLYGGLPGNKITALAGESATGKTFFLNSGTEFQSTLPTPAAGLEYTFVVKAAPSGASYTIVSHDDSNIIIGLVTCATADDLGANDDDADIITFVDGQAVVGDWIRVISDGTKWYFSGACKVAEGITTGTS